MSELKVGVIGLGFGRSVVAPAFGQTGGCCVVDIVSPRDRAAVTRLCGRRDVDLIAVHSPPFLHLDHVRIAVAAGHAVLCDKPFGRHSADAAQMLEVAREAGVPHFVNFELRQDPVLKHLRAVLIDREFGQPRHIQWTSFMPLTRKPIRKFGWVFDAAAGGGWIGAWGAHQIDYLRHAIGEIVEVGGIARTLIGERPDDDGAMQTCSAEDFFAVSIRFEAGATASLESTSAAAAASSRMTIACDDATLEVIGNRQIRARTLRGDRDVFEVPKPADLLTQMRAWTPKLRDRIIDGAGENDLPTFEDGLAWAKTWDRLRALSLADSRTSGGLA